jgi:hypothetical protein
VAGHNLPPALGPGNLPALPDPLEKPAGRWTLGTENRTVDLKIRGIYAAALSALLPQHGFAVVEASPLIAERLGLPAEGQAEVHLDDRPDRQGVRLASQREAAVAGRVARRLAGLLPDAVPRWLRRLAVWEVEFPGGSKCALDQARAAVWPTLPDHHLLKIVADEAVDEAERELTLFDSARAERARRLAEDLRERFIFSGLRPGSSVVLTHVKPAGRELELPGRVESLRDGHLRLSRTFRSGGTYDTLGSPKRAGDHGQIEQLAGSWVSRRCYLRVDGLLIGELYNIQTPTELYPSGVRYLDLEVDVAILPNGRVEVVDQRELQHAVRAGHISEPLAQRALAIADGVRAVLAAGGTVRLEDWV